MSQEGTWLSGVGEGFFLSFFFFSLGEAAEISNAESLNISVAAKLRPQVMNCSENQRILKPGEKKGHFSLLTSPPPHQHLRLGPRWLCLEIWGPPVQRTLGGQRQTVPQKPPASPRQLSSHHKEQWGQRGGDPGKEVDIACHLGLSEGQEPVAIAKGSRVRLQPK